MWARAARGDKAYAQLTSLIKKATAPNLFDMHPDDIFQIDGNLGGAAGIAEMLLQSTDGSIAILPALPVQWHSGEIKGFKVRGAHEVSLSWMDCKAKEASIIAGRSGSITVRYKKGMEAAIVKDEDGKEVFSTASGGKLMFRAQKGKRYTITGFDKTE